MNTPSEQASAVGTVAARFAVNVVDKEIAVGVDAEHADAIHPRFTAGIVDVIADTVFKRHVFNDGIFSDVAEYAAEGVFEAFDGISAAVERPVEASLVCRMSARAYRAHIRRGKRRFRPRCGEISAEHEIAAVAVIHVGSARILTRRDLRVALKPRQLGIACDHLRNDEHPDFIRYLLTCLLYTSPSPRD